MLKKLRFGKESSKILFKNKNPLDFFLSIAMINSTLIIWGEHMHSDSFSFDITPKDLYSLQGLIKIQKAFLTYLQDVDQELFAKLNDYYLGNQNFYDEVDAFAIQLAPHLEDFITFLFNITHAVFALQKRHQTLSIISTVKRTFVQRFVVHKIDPEKKDYLEPLLQIHPKEDFDLAYARAVLPYLEDLKSHDDALKPFVDYALWALATKQGKEKHKKSALFNLPYKKTEKEKVKDHICLKNGRYSLISDGEPITDSFSLRDKGLDLKQSLAEANYCIKCHLQKKDSCKRGLKKPDGEELSGCPLDVNISAFMTLKSKGYLIAALAVICVDNPLLILTGHRICNDCKKACIFQKQDAVDIPGVESEILKSVLELPFGFEIYSLLTKWNPLNIKMPLPLEESGHTALVVGQGPSGIGIAHELMRSGIGVFAIDGLKIEPIPSHFKDISTPIKRIYPYIQDLDTRIVEGFGGVLEYGITIRWDKNNLFLARLLLERNALYTLKGGIRFQSQITQEQALSDLGFDHIVLCLGSGSPKSLNIQNGFPKGVRFASDFLMSLQLTGAFKEDSVANLTVDMPIVVVGGGLTAVDTATEAQRYYLRQILKIKKHIDDIKKEGALSSFLSTLTKGEADQLNRWQDHADQYIKALKNAKEQEIVFDAKPLLKEWGGATVVYRKGLEDAPCFKLNPEEVKKAFEEGIDFKENTDIQSYNLDDDNNVIEIITTDTKTFETASHPARTVLIAIGTIPIADADL
ncbi:MAG: hypothetical protein HEEMFOPI_00221 [Holosporales bacterium]